MADVTKKVATSLDMLGNKLKGFALDGINSSDTEHPLSGIKGNDGEIRYDAGKERLRFYQGNDAEAGHQWPALALDDDVKALKDWKANLEAEELWGKTTFSLGGSQRVSIGASGAMSASPVFSPAGLKPTKIVYECNVCGISNIVIKEGDDVSTGVSKLEYTANDTTEEGTIITVKATATYANGKTKVASASVSVIDSMYIFLKEDKTTTDIDRAFMSGHAVYTAPNQKDGTYIVDLEIDSYILFGVPKGLGEIKSIKSSGFDVPFEKIGEIKIPGTFRIYATSNPIAKGNGYSLVIA